MKSTVVFSMISDIFFPAQLFNINFLLNKFVHIKLLDFILQFISLLSYNSLNLFTPLLILVHLLLIVELQGGGRADIFADMCLFPELCGFLLAAPIQQHKDIVDEVTHSQPTGRKNSQKNDPKTIKTQIHPQRQSKWHPKSSKIRISRRLHH